MASERSEWGGGGRPGRVLGAAALLRHSLLWASRRRGVQQVVSQSPLTRRLVRRFVAGEGLGDVVTVVRRLTGRGLSVTVDHLGEDTHDAAGARAAVAAHRALIARLASEGLASRAEVSLKLSALGQSLDGELAFENALEVCRAAAMVGMSVTLDMEDHTTTDSTLGIGARLRAEHPSTGLVIQASLRRSEADCRALAHPGSRVRLCKGAYQETAARAWQRRNDVRAAYLRCLRSLLEGGATPLIATHDPALIDACHQLIAARGDGPAHEHQMLFGVRGDEQARLVAGGEEVRVYVPFGERWYPYLMRRMAERPANLALVLRALVGGGDDRGAARPHPGGGKPRVRVIYGHGLRERRAMSWHAAYLRWLYRGGRPSAFARFLTRTSVLAFSAGIGPRRAATLEVVGRNSGRLLSCPVVVADWQGERYLVSMLGETANWVRNVRAAGGRAVVRHGKRESVLLEDVAVEGRPPILRRYLALAPGARPHIPVDRRAPLEEFEAIASQIPVFHIASVAAPVQTAL